MRMSLMDKVCLIAGVVLFAGAYFAAAWLMPGVIV